MDPYCTNRLLWQRHVYRHDLAKVGDFYNGDLWGNSLFLSDPTEILRLSTSKTLTHIM